MSKGTHDRGKVIFDGDLEDYSETYLICRDIGHQWIPSKHWEITRKGTLVTEYRRKMQCPNCGMVRNDYYDKDLRISGRYYSYPEGYLTKKGTDRIDSAVARREQIRRFGLEIHAPKARRRLRAV